MKWRDMTRAQKRDLVQLAVEQAEAMDEAGLTWFFAMGHWSEQTGWLPLCHDGRDY